MIGKCISVRKDGQICGKPASAIDYKGGGLVCQEHAIDLLSSCLSNLQEQIWDLEKKVQNLKNMLQYQDNQAYLKNTDEQPAELWNSIGKIGDVESSDSITSSNDREGRDGGGP